MLKLKTFREILKEKFLKNELQDIFNRIDSYMSTIKQDTNYHVIHDKNDFCLIVYDTNHTNPIAKFNYGDTLQEIINDTTHADTTSRSGYRLFKDRLGEHTDIYLRRVGKTLSERRARELRETQDTQETTGSRERIQEETTLFRERVDTRFILEQRGSIINQRQSINRMGSDRGGLSEALRSVSKVNPNSDKTISQTYKVTNSYDAVNIPMNEILLKLGYHYKKEKCTKRNFTMQNANGDLIVISRMPNEHYLYFNPFNDDDKGNIHSFCKNRGISLKDILYNNVFEYNHKLEYTDSKYKDNASIKAAGEFEKFKKIESNSSSSYLQKRGIDASISNAFNIRLDNYNNVCFPHFQVIENPFYKKGFLLQSGYTSKLRNPMTKDAQGNPLEPNKFIKSICYGSKGLEILKSSDCSYLSNIQNIIITESSIDSLSLFEIKNKGLTSKPPMPMNFENTLLCATGGNKNEAISKALLYLKDNTQKNTNFFIAMDNDDKGQYFQNQIKEILGDRIIIQEQSELKDFNEDLQAIKIIQDGRLNLNLDKGLKEALEYQTFKLIKDLQKASEQKKQELIQKLEIIKTLRPFTNIQRRLYQELTKNINKSISL